MPFPMPQLAPVERRLLEQYLNTYWRETGCLDPRLPAATEGPQELRQQLDAWRLAGWMPFLASFGSTGCQVAGALSYFSPIGYHRAAGSAWLGRRGDWSPLTEATPVIDLIAEALAGTLEGDPAEKASRRERFRGLMRNSLEQVRFFHRQGEALPRSGFIAAEQGLRFGHIFHVTSKSNEGFTPEDARRYAPELGASFRMHYFAADAGLLEERSLDGGPLPEDPEALRAARERMGERPFGLLPCHPWQAGYLLKQPAIAEGVARGALAHLGPLGAMAWPTSSVRTVWLPDQDLFLKLSLDIRITNFVRNNPPEHLRRALDASLALSLLPAEDVDGPLFHVLPELGTRALKTADEGLRAATAVLYRQAIPRGGTEDVWVAAALLEEPAEGEIPLLGLLREAAGTHAPGIMLVRDWWLRYLEATLVPMLRLFLDHGVSLEAHLQNSLVGFRGGWPIRGYARDLEGTSLCRERFPFAGRLPPDSPALYSDGEAWHRFQYYVLVNHIGHAIACLSRTGLATEESLWRDTAARLRGLRDSRIDALLAKPTLPAKANMLSAFHGRGEKPAWIEIPNPLSASR